MAYIIFALAVVLSDQLIKWYIFNNLALGEVIAFIPGLLQLTYFQNTGIAFGFLQGHPWLPMLTTPLILTVLVVLLAKRVISDRAQRWAMTAIIAGGAGNLIDRFIHGFVVDMFEFVFVRFAIFNLADVFVTLGGIGFFIAYILAELRERRAKQTEPSHE